jgi:hypothetical protein
MEKIEFDPSSFNTARMDDERRREHIEDFRISIYRRLLKSAESLWQISPKTCTNTRLAKKIASG